jgi:hypothetical protein
MVLQQHLHAPSPGDQTLASLWRAYARRIDPRATIHCITLGMLGVVVPVVLQRAMIVALPSLIVLAFGAYAAVVQPALGGRWLRPRAQRVVGTAVAALAALAGIAAGLLVLGAIFGGSIEVMRR